MDNTKLSLDTLQGGAARELFDIELQKVLKNIADPNTKAEAKRSLILKVDITPSNRLHDASLYGTNFNHGKTFHRSKWHGLRGISLPQYTGFLIPVVRTLRKRYTQLKNQLIYIGGS